MMRSDVDPIRSRALTLSLLGSAFETGFVQFLGIHAGFAVLGMRRGSKKIVGFRRL
jgi:hypothetical protein